MTKIEYLKEELLRAYPDKTNAELAELSNGLMDHRMVGVYLKRLEKRGSIEVHFEEGKRIIDVIDKPYVESNFKKETYEMMVDKYIEDFEDAETFQDRVEIGKMIIRILEKL